MSAPRADSSAPPPLTVALVGCGRIAEVGYLPAIAAVPALRLAAVVDPDARRRGLLAAAAGGAVRPFADVGSMLRSPVEAAVVCSPVPTHLPALEQLTAAGVHCLVEKPPAPDEAGAAAIARLRPQVWVGFNRRFLHGRNLLADVPAEGELEIHAEISYRRRSWRPLGDLGDAWQDLGPHLVDLALLLSGSRDADVVSARLSQARASVDLALPRGSAFLRCRTDASHRERITVNRTSGGALAASSSPGALVAMGRRALRRPHPLTASLAAQLRSFASAIHGEPDGLLASAADGVRVMGVIDAARTHAASGGGVRRGQPLAGRTS